MKQAMAAVGFSIKALNEATKIPTSTLYQYLNGSIASPPARAVAEIARATGRPVEYFFTLAEDARPAVLGPREYTPAPLGSSRTSPDAASYISDLIEDHREERRALLAQLEQANQERARLLGILEVTQSMLEATQKERLGWMELLDRGQQERLGWQHLMAGETEQPPARIPSRWETGQPPDRGTTRPPLPESAATGPIKKAPPPSSGRPRLRAAMTTKHQQEPEE